MESEEVMRFQAALEAIHRKMGGTTEQDVISALSETTTASSTPTFYRTVSLTDPPTPCSCCGELDYQNPCTDCELYCAEDAWCKARGFAKFRLRIGHLLRALASFVEATPTVEERRRAAQRAKS